MEIYNLTDLTNGKMAGTKKYIIGTLNELII